MVFLIKVIFDISTAALPIKDLIHPSNDLINAIPKDAIVIAGKHYLTKQNRTLGVVETDIIECAIQSLGLNDLYKFDPNKKIIENPDSLTTMPKSVVLLRHSGYSRVFKTSIVMWKEQPIFGFGLKSFRVKCWNILSEDNLKSDKPQDISCGNHPHNYYLIQLVFRYIHLKLSFYL